jgi:hypothetical protein
MHTWEVGEMHLVHRYNYFIADFVETKGYLGWK